MEKVDKFCYLGEMLNADGGCDSAVTARVRSAWKKSRQYLPNTHSNWKRILVKTERQGIRYLCELSDAWQ